MKKSIICQWDADVDGWELGRKGIVRSDNRLRGKHRHCLLILITGVVSPQGFLITGRRRSHRRRVPLGRRWSPTDQPLLLQRVIVGCGGFWAKGIIGGMDGANSRVELVLISRVHGSRAAGVPAGAAIPWLDADESISSHRMFRQFICCHLAQFLFLSSSSL